MCSTSQHPRTSPRAGEGIVRNPPDRSLSFNGRTSTAPRQIRRPKTQPELLPGRRGDAARPDPPAGLRVPPKVLLNVAVQRSLRPVQVLAPADWSVGDLVAAAVRAYVKEGWRPQLPTEDPSAFGLHYSQFSLDCLDPEQKVMELGSRNFFLCPKHATTSEGGGASSSATGCCSKQAEKASNIDNTAWFNFMEFLL
ncbi:hypothetical protein Cni_G09546 [Canna indica]|uniref:DUF7054 domain-containing protein n=1 Tax=Canna indica TaxID=4628 RepID=A0AAQ3K4Z8_9LILI|nr:hypothetical protein Cni_G09546 [Canna indica]